MVRAALPNLAVECQCQGPLFTNTSTLDVRLFAEVSARARVSLPVLNGLKTGQVKARA